MKGNKIKKHHPSPQQNESRIHCVVLENAETSTGVE